MRYMVFLSFILLTGSCGFSQTPVNQSENAYKIPEEMIQQVQKSEQEWLEELGEERYKILRQCGTEPPFTGKYYKHKAKGTYACAGCGNELFLSDAKYESGSGWPSFFEALDKSKIKELRDVSYGMIRTEIRCAKCDGHLGHVFSDGPKPTGLRYCVNSASLEFREAEE